VPVPGKHISQQHHTASARALYLAACASIHLPLLAACHEDRALHIIAGLANKVLTVKEQCASVIRPQQ
jgi:hypothetical protein